MKVLTLDQPYASLIMAGIQPAETRSCPPHKGTAGRLIGIHASKLKPMFETEFLNGYDIPTGVLLGHATLKGYCQVKKYSKEASMFMPDTSHYMFHTFWPEHRNKQVFFPVHYFGNYSEGRWIWYFEDIVAYKNPVPMRGHQGLWHYKSRYDGKYD